MPALTLDRSKKLLRYILASKNLSLEKVSSLIGVETETYVEKILKDNEVNPKIVTLCNHLLEGKSEDKNTRLLEYVGASLFSELHKGYNFFFQSVFSLKSDYTDLDQDINRIMMMPDKFIVIKKYAAQIDFKGYYRESINTLLDGMTEVEMKMVLDNLASNMAMKGDF